MDRHQSAHQCQQCGMQFPAHEKQCPKCDYGIFDHNRNRTFSVDIAHNLQTIDQATQQFYNALAKAKREKYLNLRVVVGGNLINREIASVLEAELWKQQIRSYDYETGNQGAFLIQLI